MAWETVPDAHLDAAPDAARRYRLLEVVRRRLRERRYGVRTEEAYVHWVRRYVRHHGRRHPRQLGAAEVGAFLSHLAEIDGVSLATQHQAFAALRFLYCQVLRQPLADVDRVRPAKRLRRRPVVLTRSEVRSICSHLPPVPRLIVTLLYGSGLRLHECLRLRLADIDLARREIVVCGGDGRRSRRVPLPIASVRAIAAAKRAAIERVEWDRRLGIEQTGVSRSPYLFAAVRTVAAADGVKRRHYLHETVVQRALAEAARRTGIAKRVSSHAFRHSFAVHLLDGGADIRTVQELLGHAHARTTVIYTQLANRGGLAVVSPADRL